MILEIRQGEWTHYQECDSVHVRQCADKPGDALLEVTCERSGWGRRQTYMVDKNAPHAVHVAILRGLRTESVDIFAKPEDAVDG